VKPVQFAEKYFNSYKVNGDELVPVHCPFCEGGRNSDKYTFALNAEKLTYNCKRGSCGVSGTFNQLLSEYNEKQEFELRKPKAKNYTPPETVTSEPSSKVENYLTKRGISEATWRRRGVREADGNIVFPYYEDGKLVMNKFRKPEKYDGKGQKAWREKGGKPVFWGMDQCDSNLPLVIVEGEFDALALDEAGCSNVVSVPSGAEDLTCIDNCWDWLEQFENIYIWPDNDEPGQEMCRKLISRLGAWRCWLLESDYKDANACLYREGIEGVQKVLRNPKEVPLSGLIRLAEVKSFDFSNVDRIPSSLNGLNEALGGYMCGMVTIFTGENASGKSTFLGQEMLNAIDNGYKVCAFSGELPAPIFRYWIDLQAAGPENLEAKYDPIKNNEVVKPMPEAVDLIRNWYYESFFLYDKLGAADEESLLEVFEYAAKRYGCKMFLIDNLMMMTQSDTKDGHLQKQKNFVNRVVDFARIHDVHVILVAHPRKREGRLTKMDVMGTGDITNLADVVCSTYRPRDEERLELNCDGIIDILKDRFGGNQDEAIRTMFCKKSKRIWHPDYDRNFFFGWFLPKQKEVI